jgi:hypothetical protein
MTVYDPNSAFFVTSDSEAEVNNGKVGQPWETANDSTFDLHPPSTESEIPRRNFMFAKPNPPFNLNRTSSKKLHGNSQTEEPGTRRSSTTLI